MGAAAADSYSPGSDTRGSGAGLSSSHLHEVAGVGEEVVHVLEVGVRVVAVPVEDVGVHVQVVARDVARRVADAVELVPQDALLPRRRGDDVHCAAPAPVGSGRQQRHASFDCFLASYALTLYLAQRSLI